MHTLVALSWLQALSWHASVAVTVFVGTFSVDMSTPSFSIVPLGSQSMRHFNLQMRKLRCKESNNTVKVT